MKKCMYCGAELPDEAKACSNCGRPLPVTEEVPSEDDSAGNSVNDAESLRPVEDMGISGTETPYAGASPEPADTDIPSGMNPGGPAGSSAGSFSWEQSASDHAGQAADPQNTQNPWGSMSQDGQAQTGWNFENQGTAGQTGGSQWNPQEQGTGGPYGQNRDAQDQWGQAGQNAGSQWNPQGQGAGGPYGQNRDAQDPWGRAGQNAGSQWNPQGQGAGGQFGQDRGGQNPWPGNGQNPWNGQEYGTGQPTRRVHGLAAASLVLGITAIFLNSLYFIPSLLAIGLGIAALLQIRKNPQYYSGGGLAVAGIILGAVFLVAYIALFIWTAHMLQDPEFMKLVQQYMEMME